MTSKARRELEREHQARVLKTMAGQEPRLSVADERELTRSVRERERDEREAALEVMLSHLARAESELRAARDRLPAVDRATRRDLDRIHQAISRIRDRSDARPPGRA